MIEAAGVVELFLGAAHHDAFAGLARAHQVHGGGAARIKPIAGEIERRTIAILQPQHVAIEVPGALQIGGFDGVMLQSAQWHGSSPETKVKSVSTPIILFAGRALRLRADHAGKSYPVEIANGRLPLFENVRGYRFNRAREQKFAIPYTGLNGDRNRAMAGAVIGKMTDGWFGEFNFGLVSRASRLGFAIRPDQRDLA